MLLLTALILLPPLSAGAAPAIGSALIVRLSPPYANVSLLTLNPGTTISGCGGFSMSSSFNASTGVADVHSEASQASCRNPSGSYAVSGPGIQLAVPLNGSLGSAMIRVAVRISYHANWTVTLGNCTLNPASGSCYTFASFAEAGFVDLINQSTGHASSRSADWSHPLPPFKGSYLNRSCVLGACSNSSALAGPIASTGGSNLTVFQVGFHRLAPSYKYLLEIYLYATVAAESYSSGSVVGSRSSISFSMQVDVHSIEIA